MITLDDNPVCLPAAALSRSHRKISIEGYKCVASAADTL